MCHLLLLVRTRIRHGMCHDIGQWSIVVNLLVSTSFASPPRTPPPRQRARVLAQAPPHLVGTALTLSTCIGFALTIGSIQVPRPAPKIETMDAKIRAFLLLPRSPPKGVEARGQRNLARCVSSCPATFPEVR